MEKAAVLIPAFNEAQAIEQVVRESLRYHEDVFVIDDGSEDRTAAIAFAAGAKIISLKKHLGFGHALSTGIRELETKGYRIIATMDADGAHDPAELRELIDHHRRANATLTLGTRFSNNLWAADIPSPKRDANLFAASLFNLVERSAFSDVATGMRVLGVGALKFCPDDDSFSWAFQFLANAHRSGEVIAEHPVHVRYDALELFHTTKAELLDFLQFCARNVLDAEVACALGEICTRIDEYQNVEVDLNGSAFVLHALPSFKGFIIQRQNDWYRLLHTDRHAISICDK